MTQRAILVGVDLDGGETLREGDALDELAELARTAGAEVAGREWQRRRRPDPAYFVGRGKAGELGAAAAEREADLIVFDEELTPAQQRNLEEATGVAVLDRTALILDIFAQRARTKEAKLQVELAQMEYLLPRLMGQGAHLSRLGGGIGTRGPGETKLESDRRRVRQRAADLRRELMEVKARRDLMRRPRLQRGVASVALVGYTNAGKSTLFNVLTAGDVLVADKLFATLDPTARRLELDGNRRAVLVDTVGFIRKLPHQLVAAFRATLEEVIQADLLLIVADAAAPDLPARAEAVQSVLGELGAGDRSALTVLNKIDLLEAPARAGLQARYPDGVLISAATGEGLDHLRQRIVEYLAAGRKIYRLLIPFERMDLVDRLYKEASVRSERFGPEGVEVEAEVERILGERLELERYANDKCLD